jgi:FkbM family methyltransferase
MGARPAGRPKTGGGPALARRRRARARTRLRALARLVPLPLLLYVRHLHAARPDWRGRPVLRRVLDLARALPPPSRAPFRPPDGPGDVRFVPIDSTIVRTLYWLGREGYEGRYLDLWERAAARCRTIVDVGAHFGLFTVYAAAANPGAEVTAVEPHPATFEVLCRNLAVNGLTRVRAVRAAVVAEGPATVALSLPALDLDRTPGGAFVGPGREGGSREAWGQVEVPAVAPARVLRDADLVKIDAEGQEARILGAAEEILRERRPLVFLEVLDGSAALTSLLSRCVSGLGYGLYCLDDRGDLRRVPDPLLASERLATEAKAAGDNFILAHPARHAWLFERAPP